MPVRVRPPAPQIQNITLISNVFSFANVPAPDAAPQSGGGGRVTLLSAQADRDPWGCSIAPRHSVIAAGRIAPRGDRNAPLAVIRARGDC